MTNIDPQITDNLYLRDVTPFQLIQILALFHRYSTYAMESSFIIYISPITSRWPQFFHCGDSQPPWYKSPVYCDQWWGLSLVIFNYNKALKLASALWFFSSADSRSSVIISAPFAFLTIILMERNLYSQKAGTAHNSECVWVVCRHLCFVFVGKNFYFLLRKMGN